MINLICQQLRGIRAASSAGLAVNTVKSWLGLLEASFLILLRFKRQIHGGEKPRLGYWRDSGGQDQQRSSGRAVGWSRGIFSWEVC